MLGSHSRTIHIGEVKRLRKVPEGESGNPCFRCKDKGPCPILSGINAGNIRSLYTTIFSRIGPEKFALIDNSKTVRGWADQFLDYTDHPRKYVHLIRDPRAIVRRGFLNNEEKTARDRLGARWDVMKSDPSRALRVMWGSQTDVYLYRWLIRNERITDFIEQNRLDAMLVTYEDLARDATKELRRLTEWIGLEFEPSQLEYWNVEHHGTQKPAYEWVKEKKTSYVDQRWKTYFPPEVQDRMVNNPAVQHYCRRAGVEIGGEGLHRLTG